MQEIKVTYRDLAKLFTRALPMEGEEFSLKVEECLKAIKAMPASQKQALQCAYVFASKVPRQEREDMFQELALVLLEAQVENVKLAYAIARCDWQDWWRRYTVKSHYIVASLEDVVYKDDEAYQLGELIVGEADCETRIIGKVDGQRLWQSLPGQIKEIVQKRLLGKALNACERKRLSRFAQSHSSLLLS
jgi:hypothetical protein